MQKTSQHNESLSKVDTDRVDTETKGVTLTLKEKKIHPHGLFPTGNRQRDMKDTEKLLNSQNIKTG